MKIEIIRKTGNSNLRRVIYNKKKLCPALTAAMGAGG